MKPRYRRRLLLTALHPAYRADRRDVPEPLRTAVDNLYAAFDRLAADHRLRLMVDAVPAGRPIPEGRSPAMEESLRRQLLAPRTVSSEEPSTGGLR